ncbi:arylesterase [Thalassospira profundimaris]|uniref:arylesterase n=1 Tax=Thalassospira profundimaris TaxID=502049 RepID=UPI000DED4DA3|nr:arylesterase [Thalassospira profundimaris]
MNTRRNVSILPQGQGPAVNSFTIWGRVDHFLGNIARQFRIGFALLAIVSVCIFFHPAVAQSSGKAGAQPATPTIVLFGDSLIAGYGLPEQDGFAPNLAASLKKAGVDARVINSGVSGDTTAAGLARLDWAMVDKPDLVVLELGANDALRGVEPAQTRKNLETIIQKLQAQKTAILLVGMMAPPNMGKEYGREFNAIYPELSEKYDVPLYPFFLDGVAANPSLNQQDGMHPNAKGVDVIVEKITPAILDALPQ